MTQISLPKRWAVIGVGKMGSLLIEALVRQKLVSPEDVLATAKHPSLDRKILPVLNISLSPSNSVAVRAADAVLLCVKPQTVGQVLDEIRSEVNEKKLLISIAASVSTDMIERRLGGSIPVIRAMPNTSLRVGAGITAISKGRFATEIDLAVAQRLFDSVGKTVLVDEKHMDAITGLSASGPAFIYIILESMAEGGVKMGLSRELATLLAAQTAFGAAKVVLDTGDHPALLKDAVTTPEGCTIDGILELEEGKLRITMIKAVVRASERARALSLRE